MNDYNLSYSSARSMKKNVLILGLLILNVILTANFFEPRVADFVKVKLGLNLNTEITQYWRGVDIMYSRMDGNVEEGSIIFLGDSITQALNVAAIGSKNINYGIAGDTTQGLIKRINNYSSLKNAKKIVLAIGINDFRYRKKEQIINNYKYLMDKLPKGTPLLVSSILPVSNDFILTNKKYSVKDIKYINTKISIMCKQRKMCEFIDSYRVFADKNGNLKSEYDLGDGVHLNTLGNSVLINIFKDSINN